MTLRQSIQMLKEANTRDLSEQDDPDALPSQFFKTIASDEFGMSRLMADPSKNNVHKMLQLFSPLNTLMDDNYGISSRIGHNSSGDSIRMEFQSI